MLRNDSNSDWERFGRDEPYFGVLLDEKFRLRNLTPQALEEFFASGEAHVERVFRTIVRHLDPDFAPATALEFGCGVGRVLVPLARRCPSVVGVDVSASMLAEARR